VGGGVSIECGGGALGGGACAAQNIFRVLTVGLMCANCQQLVEEHVEIV